MSETTTNPPPEDEALPAPPEGQEEPSQPRDEQGRFQKPEAEPNHEERRWARLTGRMAVLARERDEMAARLAALERRAIPPQMAAPQLDPAFEQLIDQRAEAKAEQIAEQKAVQTRIRSFHEQGAEMFPDWQKRCQDLQAMGADAQIAALLVDMPKGARIAGALRDDPEELEKIAALDSERGRAVALGQYAAKLEAEPTRHVSRAPRPPPPLQGRSVATPNPYLMQNTKDLVAYFREQEMKRRAG